MSLHMMLVELFPSVFNEEQIKRDECLKWPNSICVECKRKVLGAYSLYDLCINSEIQLKKYVPHTEVDVGDVLVKSEHADETDPMLVSNTCQEITKPLETNTKKRGRPVRISNKSLSAKQSEDSTEGGAVTIADQLCTTSDHFENNSGTKDEETTFEITKNTRNVRKSRLRTKTTSSTERKSSLNKRPKESGIGNEQEKKENRTKRRSNDLKEKKEKKIKHSSEKVPEHDENDTEELETKVDLYRCILCDGPVYTSPKELTEHLKAMHPQQIRSCDKCPKVFVSEQVFQHHQYCHATGRSFFCLFCDKGFQNQQLLNSHIRTHTHGTGFLCSYCGQEFSNRSNLRQHLLRHTGDKPWACTQCPSRFSMKSYLVRHQHTHTKIKQFSCDTCGSQFNRHYSLVKHQLIHTGERHFACEVCSVR
ncbi:zinc finger protein 37 homolog [Anopheles nili]|uniref:zinc finger protein 37 homolog n=1 Tax=Anopheles nili TaxID=185578 RepID=UPI00237A52B0|nr:zinc finger protein 37 homolog [Anopheles nili]